MPSSAACLRRRNLLLGNLLGGSRFDRWRVEFPAGHALYQNWYEIANRVPVETAPRGVDRAGHLFGGAPVGVRADQPIRQFSQCFFLARGQAIPHNAALLAGLDAHSKLLRVASNRPRPHYDIEKNIPKRSNVLRVVFSGILCTAPYFVMKSHRPEKNNSI
jgi:hypothetical protein